MEEKDKEDKDEGDAVTSVPLTHLDLVDVVDGVVELHGLTAPLGRGAGHTGRLGGVGQGEGHVRVGTRRLGVAVMDGRGRGLLHDWRRGARHVGGRLLSLTLLKQNNNNNNNNNVFFSVPFLLWSTRPIT